MPVALRERTGNRSITEINYTMHYYNRNIGDYHKKAGRLSMLQHGAYVLLMDAIYDREKFPTLDDAIDWLWASSKEEIEAVEFVLNKFFTLDNGVYIQSRMQEELQRYQGVCLTNAINGKLGGRPRKTTESKANETQAVNNKTHSVNLKSESKANESDLKPNQEPITNNHKPITKVILIPDGINESAWNEWIDYRKSKKKPVSQAAAKKQFNLLSNYDFDLQRQIIDQSIQNDYQGLFELKGATNGQNQSNQSSGTNRLSAVERVQANAEQRTRERAERKSGGQAVAEDGDNVRVQVYESVRGDGGCGRDMGNVLDGDYWETDG